MLLIDIDHFKAVNDRYGHLTGDHVLQEVAQVVKNTAVNDTVARYGGEEIAILLVETMLEQAQAMAAALRRDIEAARLSFQGNSVAVTVSIGCAELTRTTPHRASCWRARMMRFIAPSTAAATAS